MYSGYDQQKKEKRDEKHPECCKDDPNEHGDGKCMIEKMIVIK